MQNLSGLSCVALVCLIGCSDDLAPQMMSPLGPTAGTAAPPAAGTIGGTPTAGSSGSIGVPSATAGTSATVGAAGTASAGLTAGRGAAGTGVAGAIAGTGAAGTGAAGTPMMSIGGMGAAGAAGTLAAGSGGEAGSAAPAFKRPCVTAGSQVIFIGDSYSNYAIAHSPLAGLVTTRARKDGALTQAQSYTDYAVAGTTLAAPPADIQNQWNTNKSKKPIHVVVMDGGGNDVLINNTQCRPEGSETRAECKQVVQDSLDAAKMMFESMKMEGVSDVIFFWYPHIPGGLLTGGETGTSISDYTYPMLEAIANSASTDTFHVSMVPTVAIFDGHPEYFYTDGLHANDTGEGKIADAVWQKMKDNCIGQAAGSSCCMP
jgi:lysophospholipase L1-like esterase